jgi:hypothetical protein
LASKFLSPVRRICQGNVETDHSLLISAGDVPAPADFDESLAPGEECRCTRPCLKYDAAEFPVFHIATAYPDNLGRRAVPPEQPGKIIVLRQDCNGALRSRSSLVDYRVTLSVQPEFLDVYRVDTVLCTEPSRQGRRSCASTQTCGVLSTRSGALPPAAISVRYAARTGWSS